MNDIQHNHFSVTIHPQLSQSLLSQNTAPISKMRIPEIVIPGSKSHTIRALLLAGLAEGKSVLHNALLSGDTHSCIHFLSQLGIDVHVHNTSIEIISQGRDKLSYNGEVINLGNSGTTLYFATALACLSSTPMHFDGDESLRHRSALPLIEALESLGAEVHYPTEHTRKGCLPYTIHGPLKAGNIYIECSTSQYLSALLFVLSFVQGESEISATLVGEFPYVEMTLSWLKKHTIHIQRDESYTRFIIPGGGHISTFETHIPGDFSSASFFFGITAITGTPLKLRGLQKDTTQADMKVLDIVRTMGCEYRWEVENNTSVLYIERHGDLKGGEFDLSEIPDALPILAVVAAYASSPTKLYNVAHARKKETDRIAVMTRELQKVRVAVTEFSDGLSIMPNKDNGDGFSAGAVDSHHDHRIAMAFACGALKATGEVVIQNADAVSVTFPHFFDLLESIGAHIIYSKGSR